MVESPLTAADAAAEALREFLAETAAAAQLEAGIVERQALLGDLPGLRYGVAQLVGYCRAIAKSCRDLEALDAAEKEGGGRPA
jgi:hypothetical protein